MNERPVTVLIADDHPSVRAGLRLLLETAEGVEVVGEAADGATAVQQTRRLCPDVVLMDARMPGMDGIEATRQITREQQAEVLMLTTFDLDEVVFGALRAGASGFLLKSAEPAQLIDAIRRVAAGDGVVAPEVTRKLLREFAAAPEADGASPSNTAAPTSSEDAAPRKLSPYLTPRELDVLATLGRGLTNAQIAAELHVSMATVKTHVSSILAKQHLTSRMQAAILAREAGLA
ncbi:response regulator transcription factor [Nesterenkonia rhizosphaerae]|uniref:Response regulator transcription factor n=1 Tax=Nesterenkonia rhizosphaerae TaxID=1348272 RepID=A0ABP9FZJ7_9MICC